jgi:microcystin-dependent protein
MSDKSKKLFATTAVAVAVAGTLNVAPAHAGLDPFIGEIMAVGFTFCPRGWANADGQLLPIAQNTALFSLYGTTYGGDGRTTFALPDLRGRTAIHTGNGPGLTSRQQGSRGGSETNTLTINQMPPHNHSLNALSSGGNNPSPTGLLLANDGSDRIYAAGTPDTALAGNAIGTSGSGQPVNNMQPYLTIRYCVALQGVFPSRN